MAGVVYFNVVVATSGGALEVEGVEGQVDGLVDRHLDRPQAVQPGLVEPVQVGVWRTEHAHGHGQVATAALSRTCRRTSTEPSNPSWVTAKKNHRVWDVQIHNTTRMQTGSLWSFHIWIWKYTT